MTTPLVCLVLYAGWTILLVVSVLTWRSIEVLADRAAVNAFPSGTPHGSGWYWRLNRAHMNAAENLPIFATAVVATHLADATGPWLDSASIVIVVARVAQSLIHVSSNTAVAVNLRFAAYLTQLVGIGYVFIRLLAG